MGIEKRYVAFDRAKHFLEAAFNMKRSSVMVGDIPFSLVSIEKINYTFKDGSQVPSMVTDSVLISVCLVSQRIWLLFMPRKLLLRVQNLHREKNIRVT